MAWLPMELWAEVASHLSMAERFAAFWSLRRAGVLPATHTHPADALQQFCAVGAALDDARAAEERRVQTARSRILLQTFGFEPARIEAALALHAADFEATLDALLAAND